MANRNRPRKYKSKMPVRKRRKRKVSLVKRCFYSILAGISIVGIFYGIVAITENSQPSISGAKITNPSLLTEERPFDIVYGNDNAPITIVEYASLTCGHCKMFYNNVVVPLKSSFIESGKVRLVYRDYPLNKPALEASMLLSCLPSNIERRQIIGKLFSAKDEWRSSHAEDNVPGTLRAIFSILSDEEYTACLDDTVRQDNLLKEKMRAQKELSIKSTPTIFINGELYRGRRTIEAISRAIEKY